VIEDCRISRFGGDAVVVSGGAACGVVSCRIDLSGRGGIVLGGGDRKSLAPARHYVTNCHLHELSRVDPTYTPAVLVTGVGQVIAHNHIHDLPSSAMRVGGNDHVIEFNAVSRVVLESDDQGGVDMWGDPTARGNVFRYNRWSDIGRGADGSPPKLGRAAIRFDDAISGQLVEDNIFVRCGAGGSWCGAIQIHGGRDQVIRRNLFVDCPAAVSFSQWSQDRWRDFVAKKFPAPDLDRDLYLYRYPEMANLTESANANTVTGNLAVNCGRLFLRPPSNITAHDNRTQAITPAPDDFPEEIIRRAGIDPAKLRRAGLYPDAWRR
jgi:hypothetical protein